MPATASARPPRYGPTSRHCMFLRSAGSCAWATAANVRKSRTFRARVMARGFITAAESAETGSARLALRQQIRNPEVDVQTAIHIRQVVGVIGVDQRNGEARVV